MIKLLNTNSFLNKIAVQEASLGKFICPKCSTFFTNSKTEYEDHLRENHIDYDQVSCIYCAVSFDFSKISNHIESHFEENLMSTNVCNLCNTPVKMDSQESVLDHLMFQHNNDLICPLCKIEYVEYHDLVEHINDNLKIVYHCTFESCQMKTNDNEELNFHKNISGHISDSCFEEHTFNCLFKDEDNKFNFNPDDDLPFLDDPQPDEDNYDNVEINETGEDSLIRPEFEFMWQLKCHKESFGTIFKNMNSKELSSIKKKLFSIEQFSIGILIKNGKKLYSCLDCDYAPQYSNWDVKKHILTLHCEMTLKDARKSLRIIGFNKHKIKKFKSNTNDKKQTTPKLISTIVKKISSIRRQNKSINKTNCSKKKFDFIFSLHYRKEMFNQVYKCVDSIGSVNINNKLNSIDQFSIGVVITGAKKAYYCLNCNYVSHYSHGDVRKHILNWHCSIPTKEAKKCLKLIQMIDNRDDVLASETIEEDLPIVSDIEDNQSELSSINEKIDNESETVKEETMQNDYAYTLELFTRMDLFEETLQNTTNESCDNLRLKMATVDTYSIGVMLVNSKKSFQCKKCDYISHYSNWDVKKHILVWHCGINNADSYKCIKFVDFRQIDNNTNEIVPEIVKKVSFKQKSPVKIEKAAPVIEFETPFFSGNGTLIKMNYFKDDIKRIFTKKSEEYMKDIERKMEIFKKCALEVVYISGVKYYVCVICGYKTVHNQGDVKKHIMARHCGIGGYDVRDCIKLCKKASHDESNDTIESDIPIENDRKILKFKIKDIINRQRSPKIKKSSKILDTSFGNDCLTNNNIISNRKRKSCSNIEDSIKKPRLSTASFIDEPKKILIDRDIDLKYSEPILKQLCKIENVMDKFPQIKTQLKIYCQTKVRVARKFNSEIFICSHCNWFTWKSIVVVANHIISKHCGIDESLIPLVEMSTNLNDLDKLMSDNEINQIGWKGKPILKQKKQSRIIIDLSKN